MKKDIIFAGVGGQGIISIASILVRSADKIGLNCKQCEIHGMSQRGGAVFCHVRISDKEIHSNIIPKGSADIILSMEPMEALRYTDYLSEKGVIISNNQAVKNISYPNESAIIDEIKKHTHLIVGGDELARELGNPKAVNVAMLGALCKYLELSELSSVIKEIITAHFVSKGDSVVNMNISAFEIGRAM